MGTYLSLTKSEVEGGMLQVRKKLWKGVVRRKSDETVVWQCKHNHSRPEFNSRYESEDDLSGETVYRVWETSALNCGRAAYRQWNVEALTGEIGAVGNPDIPVHLRPDVRFAHVGEDIFSGKIQLNDNGHRSLSVKNSRNALPAASLNIDVSPKKGLTLPDLPVEEEAKMLTALWLFKGGIWGVVFQDHNVNMSADGVLPEAIEELMGEERQHKPKGLKVPALKVPKKEEAKEQRESTGAPRLEISSDGSKRVYEVIAADGEVKGSFFQRGRAVAALEKLR